MKAFCFDSGGFLISWLLIWPLLDICLIPPGTCLIFLRLGDMYASPLFILYMAQQHLIKGESNLSSSTDRWAFWRTLCLTSCACCDINRAISALTCNQHEQTGKYSAEWNAVGWLSPLGKSYYSCQTLKSFFFPFQQFCRTSAGSPGTQYQWERVKLWFCSVALHPITEVLCSVLTLLHCLL